MIIFWSTKMRINTKNKLWIYLTLIISIALDIFSPEMIMHWKPLLTLLCLIYWNMALPDKVGITEAMLFGLLLDLYTGSLLGLHALLFVCFTYACQRFFYQFRVSPLWQQSVILFFLFFIFKMVFTFDFLNVTLGMNVSDLPYISSAILFALISSLCWPPTVYVLRELRRKKIAT